MVTPLFVWDELNCLATRACRRSPNAGHEWLYVLRGQLRVRLGDNDFVMGAGEAAEFDCQIPLWFGAAGRGACSVGTASASTSAPRAADRQPYWQVLAVT